MKTTYIKVLRWMARISGGLTVVLLLLFFGAYWVQDIMKGDPILPGTKESIGLIFFPISFLIGLILAWKWEGLGGFIAVISIIFFHLTMFIVSGNPYLVVFIEIPWSVVYHGVVLFT